MCLEWQTCDAGKLVLALLHTEMVHGTRLTGLPKGYSRGSGGGCTDHPAGSICRSQSHRLLWLYTVACRHRERLRFLASASTMAAS